MLNKSCLLVLSAVLALAGCASKAEPEPTSAQDDAIIGALTSPIGLQDHHMIGTWQAIDAAHFHGGASSIHFADDHGKLTYRMGDAACGATCPSDGSWYVTQNPIVWFFAGTYVDFQATSSHQASSLFVSRGLDGEIRLVDLDSWDWQLGRYANTWARNPALTVDDLWH
jgi:hypothetical protein